MRSALDTMPLMRDVPVLALASALLLLTCFAAAKAEVRFTPAELGMVESHGPWPPAFAGDPSNRYSGDPGAIALGASLFGDARLSRTGTIACSSCHQPDRLFTDGQATGTGFARLTRNTPTILNTAFMRWYGWDGAADSLWAQTIRPIVSKDEMDGAAASRNLYGTDARLRAAFIDVFGISPANVSDQELLILTAKALAAWQETRVTLRTPFDEYRDALLADDTERMALYPGSAQRGLKTFVGKGRCSFCHFGPAFTNREFADIGIPHFYEGGVDKGRFASIAKLQQSPYTLMGDYNDNPDGRGQASVRFLKQRHDSFGQFRVPSLRSVAETAPYIHLVILELQSHT